MGIILLYKPVGKTPLDMLKDINEEKKTYAGRLDPMAHGLLLVLTNEHRFVQSSYHNFDKVYRFELLLNIETDTLDILGLIKNQNDYFIEYSEEHINKVIKMNIGKHLQEYPHYSSVRVNSKPLFHWAKLNKLDTIEIPKKSIEIYNLELIKTKIIDKNELKELITSKIKLLGDRNNNFRELEILEQWKTHKYNENYQVLTLMAHVSSGTYIRKLCKKISNDVSNTSNVGLALDIYRESIGDFTLVNIHKNNLFA